MTTCTIIDTETTSVDHATGSLVEVAWARFDLATAKVVDCHSFLVKRSRGEHGGVDVHGIPEALATEHGITTERAATLLCKALDASTCAVAHFADFDRKWFADWPVVAKPWADSNDFEWPRPIAGRSLTAVALAHGVGVNAAHRAMDDVLTLARLLERCAELGANVEDMVRRALRPKVKVQALVSYDDRDKAKDAGFQWVPERKSWERSVFVDDVEKFGFRVREIASHQVSPSVPHP